MWGKTRFGPLHTPTKTPLKVLDDAFIVYITSRTFRLHIVGMLCYLLCIDCIIILEFEIQCIIIPLTETEIPEPTGPVEVISN